MEHFICHFVLDGEYEGILCDKCHYQCSKSELLKEHALFIHEGVKYLNSKVSLKLHINSYDWLKPYKCEECWKAFGLTYAAQWQMGIHTRLKPYGC